MKTQFQAKIFQCSQSINFCLRHPARIMVAISMIGMLIACDWSSDGLRRWGEESRRNREQELQQAELKRWQRDLKMSKAEIVELHKNIHELVQESNHQGQVAWKIAHAYMQARRYEMAGAYFQDALQNKLSKDEPRSVDYDRLLPMLEIALQRHNLEKDLLLDAGLCYANASRAHAWEIRRWLASERLFKEVLSLYPEDGKAIYELALLYGKSTNQARDPERAIELLDLLVKKETKNIPARFAYAHILTEQNQLDAALENYIQIQRQLEELQDQGVISNLENSSSYKNAKANQEKLETCLQGKAGCEILIQK